MTDSTAIRHLPDHDAFLLTGSGFSYAFAVGADGSLRHLHWGGPLGASDVAALLGDDARDFGSNTWSHPRAHTEELVQHGGRRLDETALKVEFADGVRALDLAYAGHRIAGDELAVTLTDRHYPFDAVLSYRVRPDEGVLERRCELVNRGEHPVVVDRAASASWPLPWRPRWEATWLAGMYAAETQVTRRALGPGRLVLESRRGIPGHAAQPWLALDAGAGDTTGEVWSVALAWSGSWRLVGELAFDGRLHVTAGVNDYDLRLPLAPGTSWTTPVVAGVYTAAGHDDLTDRWHRYERRHVAPRPDTIRPVLYNSWEATFFDVRPESQVELARRAAGLGAELFVVDDGWFAGRDDESAGIGDWTPDARRFPDGLAPLAEEVHRLGMRFGVWVEPESVSPDSELFRAHPDWIFQWPTRPRTLARQTHLLALSRPEVRDHLVTALDGLLSSAPIDALKWDLNRPLTEASDGVDASSPWIAQVEGLYEVIDRVRALHPGVWIESCASGGGRADLGIMSRTEWTWPSDNTDALERLAIQHGYLRAHSPHTMMAWVTDSPTYLTKREIPLRFRFHSAMCGLLGIGGNLATWSTDELAGAAEHVTRYKHIRTTVQFGTVRRLDADAPDDVTALSYQAPDGGQLAVFAFAPSVRHLRRTVLLRLRDLDPAAVYVDADTGARHSGALLMHHGLRVPLVGDYASALVVLDRAP
ncbi:alpha-galactosidase [Jiangella asiatica]|uniref:alpha-galactosidase n=1 Tax=Jiangella asiatica TaxID=2530372 RepID=UPI00193DE88C|nr:alpha-galactosidase [Jiangella asiatica]